ncbi:YrbL family protein [Vibrio sinaloensis]|uniref:YrbL family protein n=1 Tax=Photobacterium sp. (strain ATCC 43367) TaxID=379097 RepID=UPI0035E6AF85
MPSTIDLSQAKRVGTGNERICFEHPNDPSLCIKVYHPMEEIMKHTKVVRQQNEMEAYYFGHLEKRGVPFLYLPKCHGWIDTSLGRGLVFDRVINDDGSSGVALTDMLADGTVSQQQARDILTKVQDYLLQYSISICDVSPGHILMQRKGTKLIPQVIDGVGSRYNDWKLYLLTFVHFFARRKTKSLWQKLISMMLDHEHTK